MTVRQSTSDTGFGVCFSVSAVIHLAVFSLLFWWGRLFPIQMTMQETYYVDVVNLPVASPRAGSPTTQKGSAAEAPPPPDADSRMTMPTPPKPGVKAQSASVKKTPAKTDETTPESSAELDDRMAKLGRKVEAQQVEAALAKLGAKMKSQGSGRAGMPAASGTEAGSDYMAYVQSRLRDAFQKTINHTSQNPEMSVRLFIDTDGKLARKKAERSSGDRAFEISVFRAIDAASVKFTPPPGRKVFEGVFVFKREGISPNRP